MRRDDLTDAEWERVATLLPQTGLHSNRTTDDRTVLNGLLYQARTGVRWRYLPDRYGCWVTIYKRHRAWLADGTWQRLALALHTADPTPRRAGPAALDPIRSHPLGSPGSPPDPSPLKDSAVLASLQALLGHTVKPKNH
ncbi:transposase [Nonomuraea gerenzanensis]|uniref:Mobile element protein n=1 Tax=Nonomuraea gerenzanensis TaxID=93944 RepID=A0A1M4EP80_9ACTN|nr:transposase [Nonomuraea gerenzanensis]UBU12108.1 transposase [Nonomuraea gerenzanensis]SBP00624.1 Mobile element protein [Nonomuraea gerenzanensis]